MIASKAKIDRNGFCMTKMKVAIRLGREASHDRLHGPLLEHVCEKPLLENGIRIFRDLFIRSWLFWFRIRDLGSRQRFCGLLSTSLFRCRFLCALLRALLQLVPRHHVASDIVKNKFDSTCYNFIYTVLHDELVQQQQIWMLKEGKLLMLAR